MLQIKKIYKNLYLGDIFDAEFGIKYNEAKIGAVINCSSEIANFYENNGINYLKLYIKPNFEITENLITEILDFLSENEGKNILIHCGACTIRSPAIMVLVLELLGIDHERSLDLVQKKVENAIFTRKIVSSLKNLKLWN